MSSKKFWKLEIYEWSLWLQRIVSLQSKRQQDHELLIELERNSMALLANLNRSANTAAYSGRDFYKLSYDEVVSETDKVITANGEQMFKILSERFKNKPLRNGRGNRTSETSD